MTGKWVTFMILVVGSTYFVFLQQATLTAVRTSFKLNLTAAPTRWIPPPPPRPPPRPTYDLTVSCIGRLGNHMFTVASAYGIALHNQRRFTTRPAASSPIQLQSIFDGVRQLPTANDSSPFSPLSFPRWGVFEPSAFNLSVAGHVLIDGYLQSYKYFHDQQHRIRDLFRFSNATVTAANHFITQLTPQNHGNSTVVGIHVRRGDYIGVSNIGYVTPDVEYYHRAMEYFRKKLGHVLFIVISDDLHWCNNNLKATDVVVGSTGTPPGDMCALSMLDHMITSAGTFSWWAAYLNRGERVYFRDIIRTSSELSGNFNPDDYFPTDWTPL